MKPNVSDARRSECPISSALDIVGDKWTLLVLRDLLDGKTRFTEFERSPEGITTNILSDRLRRLESNGMIDRRQGDGRRYAYHLTSKGEDLRQAILALAAWGNAHLADTWIPPDDYLRVDSGAS